MHLLRMFEGIAKVRGSSSRLSGYCFVYFETPRDLAKAKEFLSKFHPTVEAVEIPPSSKDRELLRLVKQKQTPTRSLFIGLARVDPNFDLLHALREYKQHMTSVEPHKGYALIFMDSVGETIRARDFLAKYYPKLQVNYYERD